MREIKFRGFHPCEDGSKTIALNGSKIKGIWLYGSLLNNVFFNAETEEPMFYIIDTREVNYNDNYNEWIFLWDSGAKRFEVIPSTIGQFTGLHDKNGKEIYEGDIVCWGKDTEPYVRIAVVEINPDIKFSIKSRNTIFRYGNFAYKDTENHLEIIGNIHENADLLEGE